MDRRITVVAGPTASGKSDVSIKLAEMIGGEVVVADSMQVYRGMDIGTAKVPEGERRVPHHCIDLVDPGQPFSSALYQDHSRAAIEDILGRGSNPILSGGTGFYIRAAIDDYRFPEGEQTGNPIRYELDSYLETHGPHALWERLYRLDPESAMDIHPNNSKRVARALELYQSGHSYHKQLESLKSIPQVYEARMFCIDFDRDELIKRIDARVDAMRDEGLVHEVKRLLDDGFRDAVTASSAIGYKEVVDAFDGLCSMEEAFDSIKTATRRYAKRQRSWFRNDARYKHIDGTGRSADSIAQEIAETAVDTMD